MTLPKPLTNAVRAGNAFLFLGAGASMGAVHPKSINPPNADQLAKIIADKFLDSGFLNRSLSQVAELAISETDLNSVQELVASQFRDFYPADFHKIIPKFVWSGIATTNYDLIIERAYNEVKDPLQMPAVFTRDGEKLEEKIRSPKNVMYLKLHGCITQINDKDLPLILTPDQYQNHKEGRSRLFEKLLSYSKDYPFIFVGHSLGDMDIRAVFLELEQLKEAKPRSYLVTPQMTPAEVKLWESKKITHIAMSFKDFLNELDASVPSAFRGISILADKTEMPIYKRLSLPEGVQISESLDTFLNRDVDYLHSEYKTGRPDPKSFYKGVFIDWSPIASNLDVPRKLTETMISELILPDEGERMERVELFVLKGYAGSGKSVLLKRLAWDAAITYDKLCLFVKQNSFIDFEPIFELYRLSRQRIFMFIDPISEYTEILEEIIQKARKEKILLTIIGGERYNEWNISCTHLDSYVTANYDDSYLNDKEIEGLINLLRLHKSLGYLEDKSIEVQREQLGKRAGRQLLVALHEATLGKPFTEIVLDEYNSIGSKRAQSLYLSVCIFHRLNVPMRAGLVSRIHGITFTEFEEQLFLPLQDIVITRMNEKIRDFEYRSRHSHIAQIVFEKVLTQERDRLDEYLRIINSIDVDYSSDQEAFKGITNARSLLNLFRDSEMIRQLYNAASKRDVDNPMLLQQQALFEMHSPKGNLDSATEFLAMAKKLAPYHKPITHSLSELARLKADKASNPTEKQKYIQEAKRIALGLIDKGTTTGHAYHTLIKIDLDELEELIELKDAVSIERKTKESETRIFAALQRYPDESYLRELEARFCDLINKSEQAIKALEKAFAINKRSSFIALRLAKVYDRNGRLNDAVKILKDCLDAHSENHIHFHLAMLLYKLPDSNKSEIAHHLRESFTEGDSFYTAQFWYARHVYLEGNYDEADRLFRKLAEANIDSSLKRKAREIVMENGIPKLFSGKIHKKEASFTYIIRDGVDDKIYSYHDHSNKEEWDKLAYNKRVVYEMAFNYYGPHALNIRIE
jgi:tetratricopeptide (TPR) repeat protein